VLVLAALLSMLSSCSLNTIVVNPNFDLKKIKRITVLDSETIPKSGFRDHCFGSFNGISLDSGYDIIERNALDAILREHNLAVSGMIDPSQLIEIGKLCGVDAVIVATYSF